MINDNDIYLTVRTDESGSVVIVDQDGRQVHGVTYIEAIRGLETGQTATISFYCLDGKGRPVQ